jgi:hypothetical protein
MRDVPASNPDSGSQLIQALQELLASLDDSEADGLAIDRATERLCRTLDELRAAETDGSPIEAEQRNQLHGALERAMRLNAVARQLVGKRLEVIDAQLQLVRTARRALGPDDDDEAGEWCDVDG